MNKYPLFLLIFVFILWNFFSILTLQNFSKDACLPPTNHQNFNVKPVPKFDESPLIHYRNCTDVASIHINLTQKTKKSTGLIYTHPLSKFSDDALRTFVREYPLNWKNDPPQLKRIGEEISEAVIELSTTRSNYTFSTTPRGYFTLLPTFGKCGINQDAKYFSTAILVHNSQCSFPEKEVKLPKDFLDRVMEEKEKRYLKRVLISGDVVANFWHSMIFIDAMCRYKDDSDLHFLISTRRRIPTWVTNFANAFGVSVVDHVQPIVAEEILTSTSGEGSSFHVRDWSCMSEHFATDVVEQDSILFIFRPKGKFHRDIPKSIHDKLVNATSAAISSLKIATFDGSETFDETKNKFRRAKIVVGPHGAAMTNLLFSKEGTRVIEYLTPHTLNRPWLFFCATTIGME